jgi:hypothetical protein
MPFLRKSGYVTLEHRVASRLVCFVRSQRPFGDVGTAAGEIGEWTHCLEGLDLAQLGVLLDWRLAPLETDPAVLREVVSRTDAVARRFARQALLMGSTLGMLQASRLSRAHESVPVVFTNEAEAYEYATSR